MNNKQLAIILKLIREYLRVIDRTLYDNFYDLVMKCDDVELDIIRNLSGMKQLSIASGILDNFIESLEEKDGDQDVY